ncbi:unnamed protein product [Ostreobium quekettii]|uniref:SMC hinge domain-containing protein n=1 Tax=Ostreobium quekettii TaxID=121088 RepID=A0A8S1J8Y7_9CHLO|nr:unnamed protein product [Ostreobium quekettii]
MSAHVEVIFDNSDNRIPVDEREVRLKRKVGRKKDEYFLQNKKTTKSEAVNLLESAGFSRSNPYYIVQQGKIVAMSTMNGRQRLELIKEVGGTRIYEERRKETLKIMEEAERDCAQIADLTNSIEQKLRDLDAEYEEFQQYQTVNKRRKVVEYKLCRKQLSSAEDEVKKLDARREAANKNNTKVQEEIRGSQARLKSLDKERKGLVHKEATLSKELAAVRKNKTACLHRKTKAGLDVKEVEEEMASADVAHKRAEEELVVVRQEIDDQEQQLDQVCDELRAVERKEAEASKAVEECDCRLQSLYQKQGRGSQFSSAKERDAWIKREVAALRDSVGKKQANVEGLQDQIEKLSGQLMELSQDIGDKDSSLKDKVKELEQCTQKCADLKRKQEELTNKRRALWRQESELEEKAKELTFEHERRRKHLEKIIGSGVNHGLNSVKRIVMAHNIPGVHGPLMELFKCNPQLFTAVEVAAGNSLFNVVVDTHEIALKIISYLNSEKAGRVKFMPLDRLVPKMGHAPSKYGTDVVPMVKNLKYDPKFEKAIGEIFGKKMICKTIDIASEVAKSYQLDCVTMDGDQAGRKGALSGGHYDPGRSKLEAFLHLRQAKKESDEACRKKEKIVAAVLDVDQSISHLMGETQKLEAKVERLRQTIREARHELEGLRNKEVELSRVQDTKEQAIKELQASTERLQVQISELSAELGTRLLSHLTDAEQAELAKLAPELQNLRKQITSLHVEHMKVQTRKQQVEEVLNSNLRRRCEELKRSVEGYDFKAGKEQLEDKQREDASAKAAVDEVLASETELATKLEETQSRLREVQSEWEELKDVQGREQQLVEDETKRMDQLTSKRAHLIQKQADVRDKIRDLGTIPADAHDAYNHKSITELQHMLGEIHAELRQYDNVNKKAADQYVSFKEELEELKKRHLDMNSNKSKIQDCMDSLAQQKENCLQTTFRGISKNFRTIFSELVPGGKGELTMITKQLEAPVERDDGGDDEPDVDPTTDRYEEVKVKVDFGGGDVMSMKQLSGGQKTVVALALIFAIQRCDPAPFYLFDEIDAALDPQYRTTVAQMLQKQSEDENNHAQFILTTFHEQLVHVSDHVYGVSHTNKISRVDRIQHQHALKFVQNQGDGEDEAEG